MTVRRPLQNQLLNAWQTSITEHYLTRQINSERSLQASLWANLITLLPNSRRTFIEPRIYCDGGMQIPKLYPDLGVCNSRSVIAVIELKYTPRVNPQFKKDLRTLELLATNGASLYVENSRYLGNDCRTRRYMFANNVLFGWASIHRLQTPHVNAKSLAMNHPSLSNRFAVLHAETAPDEKPVVGLTRN